MDSSIFQNLVHVRDGKECSLSLLRELVECYDEKDTFVFNNDTRLKFCSKEVADILGIDNIKTSSASDSSPSTPTTKVDDVRTSTTYPTYLTNVMKKIKGKKLTSAALKMFLIEMSVNNEDAKLEFKKLLTLYIIDQVLLPSSDYKIVQRRIIHMADDLENVNLMNWAQLIFHRLHEALMKAKIFFRNMDKKQHVFTGATPVLEALIFERIPSIVPNAIEIDPHILKYYSKRIKAWELEKLTPDKVLSCRFCQSSLGSDVDLGEDAVGADIACSSPTLTRDDVDASADVEVQVKEKSRWFSLLRDITSKLKIMKMEHIKLFEEVSLYKNCIMDINDIGTEILSRINQQADLHDHLKTKFIEGAKERKELYNKVLELKGNIRVFCRCRPLNAEEIAAGASVAIDFKSAKDGELTVISNGTPKKTFKFDAVFGPQAKQADVFEDTAPFATSVLDGFNVCIFAYGQTGTGKTFTMEGTKEARGVNFRILEELFRVISEREKLYRYDISVSALEVYNEQIRDLLVSSDSQQGTMAKRLEIRQVGEGMHHVPGLVEAHVNNMNEVWEVLQTGSKERTVGSINANDHSSRSHCIHCVMVEGENLLNGECTKSKLWLVDLAGSQRVTKTNMLRERFKETQNINRSLSALGDVICALSTKSTHIPFRNSKLTRLLQDSLGGDSKTLMLVQISPHENNLGETMCSLNFASRVRGIELKQMDTSELVRWKQMVEKSKQDMKKKDMHIRKMEETMKDKDMHIRKIEETMKDTDLENKNLQDKVKELESQLLVRGS